MCLGCFFCAGEKVVVGWLVVRLVVGWLVVFFFVFLVCWLLLLLLLFPPRLDNKFILMDAWTSVSLIPCYISSHLGLTFHIKLHVSHPVSQKAIKAHM